MVSKLPKWNLTNKRVLLRADLNIPINNGIIVDDTRLQAIKPTLDLILQKGGQCIVMTHIGNPKEYDPNLSTQQLIPWFEKTGYDIDFAHTPDEALHQKNISDTQGPFVPSLSRDRPVMLRQAQHERGFCYSNPARITLLENLRFFPGEKNHDPAFAQELAQLGDYYVNDAFGALHRTDTSITRVPLLFTPDKRSIGLLVEEELHMLHKLRTNPKHPFTLILGGKKAATKIPLIESLLDTVDTILLCPALAFTFAKSLGKPVGKSLVDDTMLNECQKVLQESKTRNVDIVLPIDYQIKYEDPTKTVEIIDADKMPDDAIGISIGPKTVELFKKKMSSAKTIFFNGTPGFMDQPETLEGAKNLLRAMTETSANTILTGGDSIAVAHMSGLIHAFTHVSTGGGSSLTYLSGKPLPGLECF